MGIFSLLGFLAVPELLRKQRLGAERGSSCRGSGFIFRRVVQNSAGLSTIYTRVSSRITGSLLPQAHWSPGNISVGSGGSSVVGSVHFLLVLVVLGKVMERKSHPGVSRAWLEVPVPTSTSVRLFHT